MGIGRHAGRKSDLPRTAGDIHRFTEVRPANARRGGVPVGGTLGINPGRIGPRERSQAPVVARLSVARGAFLQFLFWKPSTSKCSVQTRTLVEGATFSGAHHHSLGRLESSRKGIHSGARHPPMRCLRIQKVFGTGNWTTDYLCGIALRIEYRIGWPSAAGLIASQFQLFWGYRDHIRSGGSRCIAA